MIDRDLRPRHSLLPPTQDLEEEYLVHQPETNRIHVLKPAAREVFLLCDGSRTLDEIAGVISQRHQIDAALVANDIEDVILRLLELNILVTD